MATTVVSAERVGIALQSITEYYRFRRAINTAQHSTAGKSTGTLGDLVIVPIKSIDEQSWIRAIIVLA